VTSAIRRLGNPYLGQVPPGEDPADLDGEAYQSEMTVSVNTRYVRTSEIPFTGQVGLAVEIPYPALSAQDERGSAGLDA